MRSQLSDWPRPKVSKLQVRRFHYSTTDKTTTTRLPGAASVTARSFVEAASANFLLLRIPVRKANCPLRSGIKEKTQAWLVVRPSTAI